jgi:putative LysE/RhtB family amino acid efflux pump
VLLALGARTLHSAFRVRLGGDVPADVAGPGRAFLTAVGGTASNPATVASWAAIFAAAGAAGAASGAAGAVLLVLGVGLGSLAWTIALASGTALARRAMGERSMRVADGVAGVGLLGFGAVLAYDTVSED